MQNAVFKGYFHFLMGGGGIQTYVALYEKVIAL